MSKIVKTATITCGGCGKKIKLQVTKLATGNLKTNFSLTCKLLCPYCNCVLQNDKIVEIKEFVDMYIPN